MIRHFLFSLILLLLCNAFAYAAIDFFDVPGYMILPLDKNNTIQLATEKVTVDSEQNLRAVYEFFNVSNQDIEVEMGLPNLGNSVERNYFFKVVVDDSQVKTIDKIYELPVEYRSILGYKKNSYLYSYKKLHSWIVKFKKNERKRIEVLHSIQWGLFPECAPTCLTFMYINSPGKLWFGKIERAEYHIELPVFIAKLLNDGKVIFNAEPLNYHMRENKTVTWRFEDWEPKGVEDDIRIWFEDPVLNSKSGEKSVDEVMRHRFNDFRSKVNYEADTRHYSDYDMEYDDIGINAEYERYFVKLLRNEIFARHGRTFKSADLKSIFESTDWYKPKPDYSDDMLNDIERKNIQFILEYEKKKGWR